MPRHTPPTMKKRRARRVPGAEYPGGVAEALEDDFLAGRRRDIEVAHASLGDLDERCRWILEVFALRDPETLTTSERAVWRDKLLALALGPRPGADWRWIRIGEKEPLDEELRPLWQRVVALTTTLTGRQDPKS